MSRFLSGLLLLSALGAYRPARAQIVNVLPLASRLDEAGFGGSAEGALDWRRGSVDLLLLSLKASASWRSGPHLLLAVIHSEGGTKSGKEFVDRNLQHLRYRLRLGERLEAEGFLQQEYDQYRRLSLRALAGVGPRLELLARAPVKLALGVAWMAELERDRGQARAHPDQRLSSYLQAELALDKLLTLSSTLFVQPRLDDMHDLRLLDEAALQVRLATHLALKNTLTLAYDSRPPAGVERLESSLRLSLVASLCGERWTRSGTCPGRCLKGAREGRVWHSDPCRTAPQDLCTARLSSRLAGRLQGMGGTVALVSRAEPPEGHRDPSPRLQGPGEGWPTPPHPPPPPD